MHMKVRLAPDALHGITLRNSGYGSAIFHALLQSDDQHWLGGFTRSGTDPLAGCFFLLHHLSWVLAVEYIPSFRCPDC